VNGEPIVAAVGTVDAIGVAGTAGVAAAWGTLGVAPPGNGRTFRALFARTDSTFRRLDPVSRVLVLAAEVAGLDRVLPLAARDDTALVVETTLGCLDTDLRFARGLARGLVLGSIFPYTLPSAGLGELALRHRLRGPSLCLSISREEAGEALREGARLLAAGEARYVLAGCVDVLAESRPTAAATCRAVVALLARDDVGAVAVAPWTGAMADPFARLLVAVPRVLPSTGVLIRDPGAGEAD